MLLMKDDIDFLSLIFILFHLGYCSEYLEWVQVARI